MYVLGNLKRLKQVHIKIASKAKDGKHLRTGNITTKVPVEKLCRTLLKLKKTKGTVCDITIEYSLDRR